MRWSRPPSPCYNSFSALVLYLGNNLDHGSPRAVWNVCYISTLKWKKKHAKSYERVLGVRMLVERFVFFPFFPVATLRLSSANHQLQPCQEEKQNQRRTPNHPVARRHRWQMQMKIPQQVESKLIVLCCWKHLVAERTINWGVLSLCGHDNSWIREDSGPFKECTCEPICFFHSLQLEKQQT